MALLVPLEAQAFSLFFAQWLQILQIRQDEYRAFRSSDVQRLFWVFSCLIAALLVFSTFGQRRPYLWPNRFQCRCDLSLLSSGHPPMNNLWVDVR